MKGGDGDGAHPSCLLLDAWTLDAASPDERGLLRAHLQACVRCREQLAAVRNDEQLFTREMLDRSLPKVLARARLQRWARLVSLSFPPALAAVVVLGLPRMRAPALPAPPTASEFTLKGGPALEVVARRGERMFAVVQGARLKAGDALRFVVEPAALPYLLIGSIDGSGQASVYYPYRGGASGRPGVGPRVELPGSIVLDDSPGPERLFALFSAQPLDAATVTQALRHLGAQGPAAIRRAGSLPLPAAEQLSLLIEKGEP
jgi:hypothetical protein